MIKETSVGSWKGYKIFSDESGFYVLGLNGLNQPKKIYFDELPKLRNWIDEQFNRWLGR